MSDCPCETLKQAVRYMRQLSGATYPETANWLGVLDKKYGKNWWKDGGLAKEGNQKHEVTEDGMDGPGDGVEIFEGEYGE